MGPAEVVSTISSYSATEQPGECVADFKDPSGASESPGRLPVPEAEYRPLQGAKF